MKDDEIMQYLNKYTSEKYERVRYIHNISKQPT